MKFLNSIVLGIGTALILTAFFFSGVWVGEKYASPSTYCVGNVTYYAFSQNSQVRLGIAIDREIRTIPCKEA